METGEDRQEREHSFGGRRYHRSAAGRRGRTRSNRGVALGRFPIEATAVHRALALTSLSAALALLGEAGCSRAPSDAGTTPPAAATSWSREAMAPRGAGGRSGRPRGDGLGRSGRARRSDRRDAEAAPKPTAADAGPAIGADYRDRGGRVERRRRRDGRAPRRPNVVVGAPTLQASMATPAIERAARAQLYWNLVQRCRDQAGNILPPDAIAMRFIIDADGYITPASIVAMAGETKYTDAAHCMRRELSTATFRAPAATWGHPGEVRATLPSVD